jgi:dTDP-4-amino-4,6-dideoxygalactose transaminase
MGIPFIDLRAQYERLKPDIDRRIRAVLEHGRFIMGPEVAELEGELARFTGCRHAIAVSSGTDALLIALMAEGVGRGDAVFIPAFTFTAPAEVVLLAGATPVFVDVDPATFNVDPDDLERSIRATAAAGDFEPRAVIAVDLYGLPADYDRLNAIAEAEGLFLLADAAQSFGAVHGGRRVGALAPVTAASFYPSKPLGCYGDGGAVFSDDDSRAEVLRSIRLHGQGAHQYDSVRAGLNGRLDTLQAAVLLAKLPVLEDELAARERLARLYDERLAGLVATPPRVDGVTSAWAQYSILHEGRDRLAAALARQGVPTAIHYPRPMHLHGGPGSLPVSERLAAQVLSLPMHPYMDEATAHLISDHVAAALERREKVS